MKTETITIGGEALTSAVCHRCGAKVYPVEKIKDHVDLHKVKELYLKGQIDLLKGQMDRMRA